MLEDSGLGLRFGAGVSRNTSAASAMGALISASTAASTIEYDREVELGNENEKGYEEECWENEEEDELPMISIELERLVGYKPSTTEEIESIKKQLIEAMWMRYKSTISSKNSSGETKEEHDKSEEDSEAEQRQQKQEEDDEKEPPPDFDDQIKELLNSCVARFGCAVNRGDTTDTNGKPQINSNQNDPSPPSPFLEIMYPSRLLPPNASNNHTALDTAKIWSEIRSLSYAIENEDEESDEKITFWYHLSDHLEHTGQLLSWKYSMALELRDILYRETLHKKHELWVKEQRTSKLEQLYQVRETLVHRKEVAKDDFDKLASVKENAIRRDMLLYDHNLKRKNRCGGSSSLLGGGELSFPEEFELMGLLPKDSQLYEEEDWGGTLDDEDDIDYYNSDYSDSYSDDNDDGDDDDDADLSGYEEGGGDDHEQIDPIREKSSVDNNNEKSSPTIPSTSAAVLEIPDSNEGNSSIDLDAIEKVVKPTTTLATTSVPRPFLRRNKARRKKKARAQKKKERAEAKRKEEREQRKDHEILLQGKHSTNELVLAQTLLNALEKKVKDVEELLENLQDEEWAAEEEAETKQQQQPSAASASTSGKIDSNTEMSLLDKILAMILGALPMKLGSKDKERHFKYVKDEHEFIVKGWKKYFGRLPSAYVPDALTEIEEEPVEGEDEEEQEQDSASKPTIEARKDRAGFKAPLRPTDVKLSKITSSRKSSSNAAATATATPQEQRMALGIVDNDDGDWDTMAEDVHE